MKKNSKTELPRLRLKDLTNTGGRKRPSARQNTRHTVADHWDDVMRYWLRHLP